MCTFLSNFDMVLCNLQKVRTDNIIDLYNTQSFLIIHTSLTSKMWAFYLVICLLLFCKGSYGGQGECCKAFNDPSGSYHAEEYCSNYCCNKIGFDTWLSSTNLECCNSYSRETFSYNRNTACINWWTNTSWAIPVVVIGNLAILAGCITCCVCCVKGCTNNTNRSGTVFVQQPQQGGMSMVTASSQQQQQQQMGGGGYGYPPPPPGNYGVQPASYGNNAYGNQPQPSASNGAFVAPPPYPEKGGPM